MAATVPIVVPTLAEAAAAFLDTWPGTPRQRRAPTRLAPGRPLSGGPGRRG